MICHKQVSGTLPRCRYEVTQTAKPRKLSFKEKRELEGMEAQIHAVDAEVARIEGLFARRIFTAHTRRKPTNSTPNSPPRRKTSPEALRALGGAGGNQGRGREIV